MTGWTPVSQVPGLLEYVKPAPVAVPVAAAAAVSPAAASGPQFNPFAGGGGNDLASILAARAQRAAATPAAAPAATALPAGTSSGFPRAAAPVASLVAATAAPAAAVTVTPLATNAAPANPAAAALAAAVASPTALRSALASPRATGAAVEEEKSVPTKAAPPPPAKAAGEDAGWVELLTPENVPYYYNKVTKATTWDKPDCLKSSDELDKDGEWVWMPHADWGFVPARMSQQKWSDGNHHVETEDGAQHTVSGKIQLDSLIWSSLRRNVSDLVMLDDMSLPLILHALKSRFQKNEIYTNVGTILISVNPYKRLPLYTPTIISQYHKRGNKVMAPHVYLVTSSAFNNLIEDRKPQSIVISGESGAGKTECTKQALQFLAEIAGSSTSNVEQKILASNPILEAFGNAKTVRNNNSSRFGKYVEINFDHNLQITGSTNTNYLLEKIRVVKQSPGERNYHAFYQLCRGAPAALKTQLRLRDVSAYWYLSQSGCDTVDDVNDVAEYEDVLNAMRELGWAQSEIDDVYRTLAGVLHLGNMQFTATGDRKCEMANKDALDATTTLLKLDPAGFAKAVTTRVMRVTGQQDIDVFLSKEEAEAARDALAKFIYEKLFDWIVQRINKSIGKGTVATGPRGAATISILDIFGFEIFEHNQFEQLCINFTNEKLQQFFNQHTFKKEEEVYTFEGVTFTHVQYIDNQPVLDLIELKPAGILPMVDEEIKMPKGSDKTFVEKLVSAQSKNKDYFKPFMKDPKMFVVEHYAGTVRYDSTGFLEKNRDQLNDDAYAVIQQSQLPFLVTLFDERAMASSTATVSGGRKATLGSKFARQLTDLMTALNATEPHYIRCVKPNPNKAPMEFHPVIVLEQLRYSGVFEAVKIRKSGFPFRYTHSDFVKRFKCIMPPKTTFPSDIAGCRTLIKEMGQTEDKVQIGKSRVLYRAEQHREMELKRNVAVEAATIKIQTCARGWLARRMKRRLRDAKPKLIAAMKTRTIEALDACFAALPYLGFELYELTKAKRLRFVIVEEKRVEAELERLLTQDPERIFEELSKAIAAADDIELKSATAERARKALADIKDRRQARAWLAEGVAEADEDKLSWAVATVRRLGMADSTSAADAMLTHIAREKQLIAAVEAAAASGGFLKEGDVISPAPLRSAVDAASTHGVKTKAGIAAFARGQLVARVRETLVRAQGTKDKDLWRAVSDVLRTAADGLEQLPEVQAALNEVSHQAAVDEVAEALERAVAGRDQEALTFNLDQAARLKVDEGKYPIVPQGRELLAHIIEVRRLLDAAMTQVEEQALIYAVQYAESIAYETAQVTAGRQLRDAVMQLNVEAAYACKMLEEGPMREILQRAEALRLVTPDIAQLRTWLFETSEEKFVQAQLKAAVAHTDLGRRIRLTIRLKDIFFKTQGKMFEWALYPQLRSPKDWADMKFISLNREKLAAGAHKFTKDSIHVALTETEDSKQCDMACRMFKNIQGYTGVRSYSQPNALAIELITNCLADPWLRDEVYCQLVKQLSDCPLPEPERRAYALLAACLESFPPQPELENYLETWLRTAVPGNLRERYVRLFHSVVYGGPRSTPLTEMELQRVANGDSLRTIDFDKPLVYDTPQARIPPYGQAGVYYQEMLRQQQVDAQKKQQEAAAAAQRQAELGGYAGASPAALTAAHNAIAAGGTAAGQYGQQQMPTMTTQQQFGYGPEAEAAAVAAAAAAPMPEYVPPPAPKAAAAPVEDLANWAVAYSDGTPYYYNTVTGATQWDKPAGMA